MTETPDPEQPPPGIDPQQWAFSSRFRKVANRYPRRVAEAYGRDLARALADDDLTVALTVAEWERAQGLPVRDWVAIGRDEEGRGEDYPDRYPAGPEDDPRP
jgi:hypothetical protein